MSRMRVRPDDAVVRREGRRTVSEKAFFKVGASFGNNNERGDDDDDVGFERARASPARACWFAGKASAMTRRIRGFLEGSFLVPSRRRLGEWRGETRVWCLSDAKASFLKTGDREPLLPLFETASAFRNAPHNFGYKYSSSCSSCILDSLHTCGA
jgi:hypothetical protein